MILEFEGHMLYVLSLNKVKINSQYDIIVATLFRILYNVIKYYKAKKHYYLASVNEKVQQLVKQEIDGLTTVLIDLKSQYDIISKESIEKKLQTDELTKKIDSIQKIVKHSRSQIEDTNAKSKNLANLIKQKRTQLNEGLYQMKTLLGNINKLKKDNFLLQKKINVNENITKRLANNKQTEILKETVLKGKKNKVN